jgi:hypothetical protein
VFTTLVLVLKLAYGYFGFPYPYYLVPPLFISGNASTPVQDDKQGDLNPFNVLNGSLPGPIVTQPESVIIDPSMGAYLYGPSLGWMGSGFGGYGMMGYGYPWGYSPNGYGMFGMYGSGMPYGTEAVTFTTETFYKFCFPGGICFFAKVSSGEEGD